MRLIEGNRRNLERQIVNALFKPEAVSNALSLRIASLKPKGCLAISRRATGGLGAVIAGNKPSKTPPARHWVVTC